MKKLIILLLSIVFVNCSSTDNNDDDNNDDDNNGGTTPVSLTGDFLPSTLNSYWNYNVTTTNNNDGMVTASIDSLYVVSGTAASYTMEANDALPANATMNGILTNGTLSRMDSTLEIDGALEIPLDGVQTLDISFEDIILYDLNANNNTELSTTTGTVTQDFQGFPITVDYTLTTTNAGYFETMTLDGTDYQNVTAANLKVNASVAVVITVSGVSNSFYILNTQDVLDVDYYFVEDLGLVSAHANLNYTLNQQTIDLIELATGMPINFPTTGSITNTQSLDHYSIN